MDEKRIRDLVIREKPGMPEELVKLVISKYKAYISLPKKQQKLALRKMRDIMAEQRSAPLQVAEGFVRDEAI